MVTMYKMKHINYKDVKAERVEEGAKDTTIRWLITSKDGANHFAMREFEIKSKGYTPLHKHDWEHEVFILEGKGIVISNGKEERFKKGDVFFIPSMEEHQFKNTGKKMLKFLCLIPYKED